MRTFRSSVVGSAAALLLAACGGGGAPAGNPQPQDLTAYYVDAGSGSDGNAGTQGSPLKTITAALALVTTGDTIFVAPGTYDAALGEAFPLMVPPNVTLEGDVANRGDGATPTLVSGHGPIGPGNVQHAALLPEDGVVLRGLTIEAGVAAIDRYGLWIQDATVEVHDCTFSMNSYAGLAIWGGGDSDIHDNTIRGTSYSAFVAGSGAVQVRENTFDDGTIPLYLSGADLCVVEGNTFAAGANSAVYLENADALISGNLFTSILYNYGGIAVQTSAPTVRGNTFQCNQGIYVFSGTPDLGTAMDAGLNDFAGCSLRGLRHTAATTLQAQGNTWKQAIPASNSDILVDGGGTVFYGPGVNDKLP